MIVPYGFSTALSHSSSVGSLFLSFVEKYADSSTRVLSTLFLFGDAGVSSVSALVIVLWRLALTYYPSE